MAALLEGVSSPGMSLQRGHPKFPAPVCTSQQLSKSRFSVVRKDWEHCVQYKQANEADTQRRQRTVAGWRTWEPNNANPKILYHNCSFPGNSEHPLSDIKGRGSKCLFLHTSEKCSSFSRFLPTFSFPKSTSNDLGASVLLAM